MKNVYHFTVWTSPKAWSRVTPKGRGRVYKDKRQKDAEAAVRAAWLDMLKGHPGNVRLPWGGPVRVRIINAFRRPKSATKRDARTIYTAGAPCAKHKGDADNLAKTVLDALTPSGRAGVLPRIYAPWEDDAQVYSLTSEKRWVSKGREHIHVTIQFCDWTQQRAAIIPNDAAEPLFI